MLDWLIRKAPAEPEIMLSRGAVPLAIRRLPQARRLTMRLAADGSEVRISMPRWARTEEAVAFAEARRDWLERQLAAIPAIPVIGPGSALPFRGRLLAIAHDARAPRRVAAADDALSVGGPLTSLEARLRRWLRDEALALNREDLARYCARAEKPTPRIALSQAQRRWGSCAPDGTIRINWRLIMAPDFVRQSVVAHEVAHLVHFDHSPRFHALLDSLFEHDLREANRWLKQEGRGLYRWFG